MRGCLLGTQKREEARKKAEDKVAERKRKKDERSRTGDLSPRSLEKKMRKNERNAIRKEKLKAKERKEARKKLPMIAVREEAVYQSSTLIAIPFAMKDSSQYYVQWRFGVLICDSAPGSQKFQIALWHF
jgi:hypothetical protein